MTLPGLEALNSGAVERELRDAVIKKIAADLPQLTDHSPASPHVVIGAGAAWGTSLLLYYVERIPEMVEEYLVRDVMHAQPRDASSAMASLQLTFSTPAPLGGRTLPAGTRFTGGGTTWTLLDPFTFPAGAFGNEQHLEGGRLVYDYLVPVVADVPGRRHNTSAGTITGVGQTVEGLVAVTNPQSAFGGKDPEEYEDLRSRVFGLRFNEETLVVPEDYEDAIRKYLGGETRVYTVLPPPTPGFAHFSVLYADGNPLISHDDLRAHLDRRSPHAPTRFVPPAVVDVEVEAALTYDPSMISEGALLEEAGDAVRHLLDPRHWPLWGSAGNVLYRSALIGVLQSQRGVLDAELLLPARNVPLGQPNAVPRLLGAPRFTLRAQSP